MEELNEVHMLQLKMVQLVLIQIHEEHNYLVNYGEVVPGQTSGRGGDSSQVTYFKNVFDRVTLNQQATSLVSRR